MLRELHTFIAVTRYGTFSAAGQRIGLTQSAVSAQIRMLEQHLGMLLFDRSGRAAVLNANGQRVLPIAQEIVMLSKYPRGMPVRTSSKVSTRHARAHILQSIHAAGPCAHPPEHPRRRLVRTSSRGAALHARALYRQPPATGQRVRGGLCYPSCATARSSANQCCRC